MTAINTPQSASLTAQNTYTTPQNFTGTFALRARGTWVGTLTLQRSDDQGTNWDDVEEWTTNTVRIVTEPNRGNAQFRFGFKTGAYTSGTAEVQLG